LELTTVGNSIEETSNIKARSLDAQQFDLEPPANQLQKELTGITIIVPVHNEEARLSRCLTRTVEYSKQSLWDYEIILVEDGSTDGTVSLINNFMSSNPRIKLLSNKDRLGKGRAIRNGVHLAGKEYVGYMDVDLSADPSEFDRLLPFIKEYDLVVGSRILRGTLPPIDRPTVRTLLSCCYSKLFRTLFWGIGVHDPQCGLKLFKFESANTLLSQIQTSGFAFDCEVIVKAVNSGLRIKEVPIIWKHDNGSKVKILREIIKMGKDLLSVWFKANVIEH